MAHQGSSQFSNYNRDDSTGHLQGSPSKNIMKRLSTSPVRKMPAISRNSARLSPVRPSHSREFPTYLQTTPKRLKSPPSLQNYRPVSGTVSVDRAQFKNNLTDKSVQLSFPTSPIRSTYSNSATTGGDGSLSRIRARFGSGLRSPQKPANKDYALPGPPKNLLPQLEEESEDPQRKISPKFSGSTFERDNQTSKSIMKQHGTQKSSQITKPRPQARKSVKFESSSAENNEEIMKKLSQMTQMLAKVIERQDQLEAKLDDIQHTRI
ncbi:LAQU0S25e00188g1_1 [Lachancea quebecensis]|uniref:LAQU0S25e00188g1_1 n=1 Tax=Lachancea quebecensis TaxID=1654605 RepID=A0A0P1KXV5_9SACH|nr:LAQU0S25e00188g1_1 [Lachancea quebecensis]